MKKIMIFMVLIGVATLLAGRSFEEVNKHYLRLEMGMFTVLRTKTVSAKSENIKLVRTEVVKRNSEMVIFKTTMNDNTFIEMKPISPNDSVMIITNKYSFKTKILDIEVKCLIDGQKTTGYSKKVDVRKHPEQASISRHFNQTDFTKRIQVKAGKFNCALVVEKECKMWISNELPFGDIVKLEYGPTEIELIECGRRLKQKNKATEKPVINDIQPPLDYTPGYMKKKSTLDLKN